MGFAVVVVARSTVARSALDIEEVIVASDGAKLTVI